VRMGSMAEGVEIIIAKVCRISANISPKTI